MKHSLLLLSACLILWSSAARAEPNATPNLPLKDSMNRDYWLYTPKTIDPKKTYWLVVGVHGHNGKGAGAAGLMNWVDKYDNVIVVGPTFPDNGPYYQMLQGESDVQLLKLHQILSKQFKLHARMFLHGFSGGSQYAHRFASRHPESVIGVSAHSGGTWDAEPARNANFPWVISCGLQDTQISEGASMPRIDGFRAFYKAMQHGKFTAKPFVTEAGHRPAPAVTEAAEECFRVSTTGLFDYQREAVKQMPPSAREAWISQDMLLQDKEFNDGKNLYKIKANHDGWTVDAATLAALKHTRLLLDAEAKP